MPWSKGAGLAASELWEPTRWCEAGGDAALIFGLERGLGWLPISRKVLAVVGCSVALGELAVDR